MQGTSAATRAVYRPSGKVRGSQFLLGFLASAAVALVMAWCLAFALRKGFYFYCLVPLLASLPVLGVWFASLSWSHCRNKTLATGASIVLAALLYFGYFHFALLDLIGIRNVQRVDLLPHYVRIRMQTDVPQDLRFAQPARRQPPGMIDEVFNWMFFAFDLATVTAVTVLLGRYCVSRAYCESCDTWMKRATLKLAPGQGTKVWQALQAGDVHAIPRMLAAAPNGAASGELSVEHCPVCQAEGGLQVVYLTVKDVPLSGARTPIQTRAAAFFKPRHTVRLQSLANHVVLDPDEVQARSMFPALGDFGNDALVVRAGRVTHTLSESAGRGWPDSRMAGSPRGVEPVDPADAGLVLTRRNAVLQTIIGVFSIFGGFGFGARSGGRGPLPRHQDARVGVGPARVLDGRHHRFESLVDAVFPDLPHDAIHAAADTARVPMSPQSGRRRARSRFDLCRHRAADQLGQGDDGKRHGHRLFETRRAAARADL